MLITPAHTQWQQIRSFALDTLAFSEISATDCDLSHYIPHYQKWLKNSYHGDLEYMEKHGVKRYVPSELIAGTQSVIVLRLNYLPKRYSYKQLKNKLQSDDDQAAISCYALGRDYHKVIKQKLKRLNNFISTLFPEHYGRIFTDSAPVLEKPLAEKAGLGWIGKNSNLLSDKEGSFFFLGTIYSNIDFSQYHQSKVNDGCHSCQACIKICPTNAIVANKIVDARRCISYLTIENKGAIPLQFRKQIGNRIYGCDDCQLICPVNLKAPLTTENDFLARAALDSKSLIELFLWDEQTFLKNTEGSAIRRIGYLSWLRNLAVALGNAPKNPEIVKKLHNKLTTIDDPIVCEHIKWAINEQTSL